MQFGLHNSQREGATQAANNCVADKLFEVHARWRSKYAKDRYAKEEIEEQIQQ